MDRTKEISKEETILGTTERKNMKEEMVDNSHLLSSQKKKKKSNNGKTKQYSFNLTSRMSLVPLIRLVLMETDDSGLRG